MFPALLSGLLVSGSLISRAGEAVLEDFPLELVCGTERLEGLQPSPGARLLPDFPFDPARGYGYLGGEARRLNVGAAFGGDPRWPLCFREGVRKYSFRVPNREYLVTLAFLETEVAASGLRVFDVLGGAEKLFGAVDIAAEAGDFTWHLRQGLVQVGEGWLDLSLVPAPDSRPPRISRIRIEPAEAVPLSPPAPRGLRADPGFHQVVLRWEPPAPAIAGYGVFRADSAEGPFESLTALPVAGSCFVHDLRGSGAGGFYRLRAYGVRGGQSPFTEALSARSDSGPGPALKTFGLRIAAAELKRLHARGEPEVQVAGELDHLGASFPVLISCFGEEPRWQAKKSYRIRLAPERRRGIFGRRELLLLGEAGDPSLSRERLCAETDRLLGLASPETAHVHLLLNGRYQGIYVDRETLSGFFLDRHGLDRFGALVRVPGRMRLRAGWEPYGESRRQSGDLRGLAHLVHELSRLDEGEIDAYFEERFYLDRLIARLASAAVRSVDPALPGAEAPPYFLEDSRNGKWETFPGAQRGGDFGIEDFRPPAAGAASAARARRALLGFSLEGMSASPGPTSWRVLETRLLSRPALRARYLERVEAICRDVLTPERFDELVTLARAPLEKALFPEGEPESRSGGGRMPRDRFLWPQDGGALFRSAPEALSSFYRAHREALLAAVAAERKRPRAPLSINEVFLRPGAALDGEGASALASPWIEIHNSSPEPVHLGGFFLTDDLDRPRAFAFPAGTAIGAGERRLVLFPGAGSGGAAIPGSIPCDLRPSPEGGELGLFREGPEGAVIPVEQIFYGRQSEGFSQSRLPDGSEAWAFVASPTPASPNRGSPAAPPPWRYRSGVEAGKSREVTLWIQLGGAGEKAAKVSIHLRDADHPAFDVREVAYNQETFRHEATIAMPPEGRRLEYYFTARSPDGLERAYPLPGPQVPLRLSAPPPIFLNEVFPRPARNAPPGEFVELYNAAEAAVSVDGMFLSDDRRNSTKFRLRAPEPIPPRGFLVIHADGLGEGTHANFRLGNAGEYLALFARAEEGNLLIDQLSFPALSAGKSYGRERDGQKGFKVWKDPTPGARNIPRIPPELLKRKEGEPSPDPVPAPPPVQAEEEDGPAEREEDS